VRWRTGRRSQNVEDRRGRRLAGGAAKGGIGTIILVLAALYFGVDPSLILQGTGGSQPTTSGGQPVQHSAEEEELKDFVSVVLADTEDTWHGLFRDAGREYREPKLVLFSGSVQSACGLGQAAMGPFYCPGDQKVYIDLSFYHDLQQRYGAPGDFAQAYVIAHEIGHHVQTLLGISEQIRKAQAKLGEAESNRLSVRQELQADCFAGLWAHHADRSRQVLEAGDLEEALTAAAAIGDDRLQKQTRGYVTPDSFTHGSSEQRVRWFKRGMQNGRISDCNSFESDSL
jgi:predicted metalloprotease